MDTSYSRRSLNSQPMRFPTHTQEQGSKIHACAIFIFGFYWMSHLFLCISPLHENRKVLPSSCATARLQHPTSRRNIITACYKPATLTSNALRVAKGTRPLSVDNEFFLVSLGHWWPRNKNDQNLLPLAILGSSTAEDPEGMQELQDSKC